MDDRPRCEHCGDVIGVYESMVVVIDGGEVVHGSRATIDRDVVGKRFHGTCFGRARENEPVS